MKHSVNSKLSSERRSSESVVPDHLHPFPDVNRTTEVIITICIILLVVGFMAYLIGVMVTFIQSSIHGQT